MTDLTRLGRYEIRSALGKGAMGIVYKGYDPGIDRFVAIKTIRKDLVDPEVAQQYMARFKNEARAAGRLMHPHIVAVYEYGDDDTVAYIAMEYVEGAGLRDHLNRRETFDFALLVRADLVHRGLVGCLVTLDRDEGAHAAHCKGTAAVAGGDQAERVGGEERPIHGHRRAVRG